MSQSHLKVVHFGSLTDARNRVQTAHRAAEAARSEMELATSKAERERQAASIARLDAVKVKDEAEVDRKAAAKMLAASAEPGISQA